METKKGKTGRSRKQITVGPKQNWEEGKGLLVVNGKDTKGRRLKKMMARGLVTRRAVIWCFFGGS